MKIKFHFLVAAFLFSTAPLMAQVNQRPGRGSATNSTGDYSSDITVVHDAQQQALDQAREMLESGEGVRDRPALETAIKEMERAQSALDDAKKFPDKLPAAIAAEQAAYQALLKITPREYRMNRSRNSGQSSRAGQASQRQMNELDMQRQENRYETESQAATPQNARQREQTQTADRLKELSQRQQDLNGRLRELQNALQAANTEQERADIQRQLKRLQDEQRQMLASVDELRQKLEQSPNASAQADTKKQLEQTRNEMERAAQEMEKQSASGALAAGQRAQEAMQNLRDDLRKQTSSQFAEQMRRLRNEARELTQQQDEIAQGLNSLNDGEKQSLDNSADRKQIVQQIEKQQSALTNLLSEMRGVTEQAETTEPLLSKQLYDTLRRADQLRTENLLEMGSQLTERGFLPQASQAERAARTNITELARSVERAADSVLGSEAEALRYAQKELDDLARQVEREIARANGTNSAALAAGGNDEMSGLSNRLARAQENASRNQGTNSMADANGRSPERESPAENNSPDQRQGNRGQQTNGNKGGQAPAENSQRGQTGDGNNPDSGNQQQAGNGPGAGGDYGDRLRQLAVQLGAASDNGGPITGNNYVNWTDRLRDVQQVVDPADLRNQLATVLERASALRSNYRDRGQLPKVEVVREQILTPLTQVRVWVAEELARTEKSDSLVPLDRDPVPDKYADAVRKYYEKLGSAQ